MSLVLTAIGVACLVVMTIGQAVDLWKKYGKKK